MSGKANAVMWIGLFLIFANFWVTGQSTTFWSLFSTKGNAPAGKTPPTKKKSPGVSIPPPIIPPLPIPPFL